MSTTNGSVTKNNTDKAISYWVSKHFILNRRLVENYTFNAFRNKRLYVWMLISCRIIGINSKFDFKPVTDPSTDVIQPCVKFPLEKWLNFSDGFFLVFFSFWQSPSGRNTPHVSSLFYSQFVWLASIRFFVSSFEIHLYASKCNIKQSYSLEWYAGRYIKSEIFNRTFRKVIVRKS